MRFLNKQAIANFSHEDFRSQWLFPYAGIKGILTKEGFAALIQEFFLL